VRVWDAAFVTAAAFTQKVEGTIRGSKTDQRGGRANNPVGKTAKAR
jgi:hypothetical protein